MRHHALLIKYLQVADCAHSKVQCILNAHHFFSVFNVSSDNRKDNENLGCDLKQASYLVQIRSEVNAKQYSCEQSYHGDIETICEVQPVESLGHFNVEVSPPCAD